MQRRITIPSGIKASSFEYRSSFLPICTWNTAVCIPVDRFLNIAPTLRLSIPPGSSTPVSRHRPARPLVSEGLGTLFSHLISGLHGRRQLQISCWRCIVDSRVESCSTDLAPTLNIVLGCRYYRGCIPYKIFCQNVNSCNVIFSMSRHRRMKA